MAGLDRAGLRYLQSCYDQAGSQRIVLYGQRDTGMEDLLRVFCQGRAAYFYRARTCSEREQVFQWANELREEGVSLPAFPLFAQLLQAVRLITQQIALSGKKIVIIGEFQNIVKQSQDFMPSLIAFLKEAEQSGSVMALLVSHAPGWVENGMVRKLGADARGITGFLKLKEQSFFEMVRGFPERDRSRQVEYYGVLGGFPGLWKYFDRELSVRENICRHILNPDSFLHGEAARLVGGELREPGIYDTILSALACGRDKLNDLYLHTGFSRAKISVYLNHLMELEFVEKVSSFETEGRSNARKGVYRIRHPFVCFYFRYLYPHLSRPGTMAEPEFYERYIASDFRRHTARAFVRICREYMEYLNRIRQLPFDCIRMGEWAGKAGDIDIVAMDRAGHTIIGLCSWEKPVMPYEDYEWLLFCARKARIPAEHIYLFSAEGFDTMLMREAGAHSNVHLTDLASF